jgi:hypothetical protein
MAISRARRSGIQFGTTPKKARSLFDASGLPTPPINLSASAISATQINLSWQAPVQSGDSSVSSYVVTVTPSVGSISYSGTTANVTGLSANTSYSFVVAAVNSIGRGTNSGSVTQSTLNINAATGGTVTTYGTSVVHTFTAPGTFSVVNNSKTWDILLVGGGGGGRGNRSPGGGGGGIQAGTAPGNALPVNSYTVAIGGGNTASTINFPGNLTANGGTTSGGYANSSVGGTAPNWGNGITGTQGGHGGAGSPHGGAHGGNGSGGLTNAFRTGSPVGYGGGGGGGGWDAPGGGGVNGGGNAGGGSHYGTAGSPGAANSGGGGGGGGVGNWNGGGGAAGIAVIRFSSVP